MVFLPSGLIPRGDREITTVYSTTHANEQHLIVGGVFGVYAYLHNVHPYCPRLWKIPGFHYTHVARYYGVVACQLSIPSTLLVSAIRAGASEVLASIERIPQENRNRRLASTCRTLQCQIFTGRGIPAIAERIPVSTSTSTYTAYTYYDTYYLLLQLPTISNLAGDVICCRGTCRGTSHLNVTRLVPGNGVECSDSRFCCIPRQGQYQPQHTHTFTHSSSSLSSKQRNTAKLTDSHDTISLDDQRQQIFGPDLIQQISPSLGVVLLQPSLEYRVRRSHGNLENKRCFPHRVSRDKRNLILQELVLVEINCY
ncbi:hypothetical protein GE21DRAFT_1321522 [Neurospora crassa]|nr:hypothetical protein GE21DRAFT_1321522 [Neurospora crassa]